MAVGTGLQIAGGMINMYRSDPPISVYRGTHTRSFLEFWINNYARWRTKQPPIYPYENDLTELRAPDENVLERLTYWLNDYNDAIVREWGEDARLDVQRYLQMRFFPHVYKFLLNEEAHLNENHLYLVKTGEVYPITSAEIFDIARSTLYPNSLNYDYDSFVSQVVSRIRQNVAALEASNDSSSNGDSSVGSGVSSSTNFFSNSNLVFFGIAIVLFNVLKK